ncbi:MAG: ThiF family adenylyltransferase [Ignavibacteria bacterium]|nr:ThiF family adenylyltransferase [Ignavibacteria bacterium]
MNNPEIFDIEESRYSRLELIHWWDGNILKNSKILVAGCGALGNEIIKNLAMLGCGNIYAVDMDRIEKNNLSRSVLFRTEDEGKFKAETCCKRAKEINDDVNYHFYNGNVFNLGLGIFKEMDIVICGLDNREARLYINQCCCKVSKPMIDGAIEVLSGAARMFIPPETACYECTMNELDYKLLNKRKSCLLLGIEEIASGKIPTTPTISSIIAGIQVQEAVKYLHKRDDLLLLKGKGFVFNGNTNDSYIIEYQRKENCLSHQTLDNFISVNIEFENIHFKEIIEFAEKIFENKKYTIQFNNEIVYDLEGRKTNKKLSVFINMNLLNRNDIKRGNEILKPLILNNIESGSEVLNKFINKKLSKSGIPFNDIITIKSGGKEVNLEFINSGIFIEV